jgi:lipopolysaccharide-induced tumor necrosis factor-alpha factor
MNDATNPSGTPMKCPFCGHEGAPIVDKQLSVGGWVLFGVLVFFCLPVCWLPFVLNGCKEMVRKCSRCGRKIA